VKFCNKCGAKIAKTASIQQEPNMSAVNPTPTVSGNQSHTYTQENAINININDFKAFVDNHVRSTTKFQSADDLLKNSKPWSYLLICYGVPAILGFVAGTGTEYEYGGLLSLLLVIFFGFTASNIAGGIMRFRYRFKNIGKFDGSIDADELLQFLNERLSYLHPYFHEWGYVKCEGGRINLSASFGIKKRSTAIISIDSDTDTPNSGKMYYIFDAINTSTLSKIIGFTIFLFLLPIVEQKHTCLFKSTPILQAAMKYYLKSTGR
jgi:hypothetical protein